MNNACKDAPTRVFYDDIWPNPEQTLMPDIKALHRATTRYCDNCEARAECLALAMDNEGKQTTAQRAGVYGGLTPQQRRSLEVRGVSIRCVCGTLRDPYELVAGVIRCPAQCGMKMHRMKKVPQRGDEWMPRHSTLARKTVQWLVFNVIIDSPVPTATKLSGTLGARVADVRRVYDALLADGTLDYDGNTLVRRGTGSRLIESLDRRARRGA